MTGKSRLPVRLLLPLLVFPPLLTACTNVPGEAAPGPSTGGPGSTVTVGLDGRPFELHIPVGYDPAAKAPLVVLLHGFRASGVEQERYFKLTAQSDRRGFLFAIPDGTTNRSGQRFWNATEACCDFDRSGVDDSAYLRRLIDTVKSSYSVDPRRVYFVGHSNGGFMAYRMACDHATVVTAIVSLAGAVTDDPDFCTPGRAVSVLQIHGTDDRTIRFDGGAADHRPYPSVGESLSLWRRYNGCGDQADPTPPPLDLDSGLDGAETTVSRYTTGCRDNSRVELWQIKGGGHVPPLTADFAPSVVDFLLARESPA